MLSRPGYDKGDEEREIVCRRGQQNARGSRVKKLKLALANGPFEMP